MTKRAARGGDWSTTDDGIDIVNVSPYAVQCKRYKDYAPISKIEEIVVKKSVECIYDVDDNLVSAEALSIPILITKADRKPTMAVLPWEELKKLIRDASA